jgi:hypothetical protein
LIKAILMALDPPELLSSLTKELYPGIAEDHGTNVRAGVQISLSYRNCSKYPDSYNKSDITGGYAFSALGTLIGIDEAPEAIAAEILEADTFLDGCKGFDEKSVNKNRRLMFAVMLAAESFEMASSVISNTFINNALGIIKAQKIATMITIISNVLPTVLGAVIDNVSEKNDNSDTKESEQKASES